MYNKNKKAFRMYVYLILKTRGKRRRAEEQEEVGIYTPFPFPLKNLEVKEKNIPEGISFVKVNKKTGVIDNSIDSQTYFELILDENLED